MGPMSEARADRTQASFTFLEWDFFARHRFFSFAAHGCVWPRSEKLDPLRYDLSALALAAAVLAFKFPRLHPAFNVYLSAFGEILCTGFSEFPENHNIVPFHPLLAIAIFPVKLSSVAIEKPVTG
jgi:hypothetical protein